PRRRPRRDRPAPGAGLRRRRPAGRAGARRFRRPAARHRRRRPRRRPQAPRPAAGREAMKRFHRPLLFVLLLGPVLLATALAWADAPALSGEPQRADQLRRNRNLIGALVEGGLNLAGEDDPLKRAGYCNDLAQRLAGAIKEASESRDGPRTAELGRHLRS